MKTRQALLTAAADTDAILAAMNAAEADLVLVFGAVHCFESPELAQALQRAFPRAAVAGCSTAGEIAVDRVYDRTCVVTAISFRHSSVAVRSTLLAGMADSCAAGERLAKALPAEGLVGVLVFGIGLAINGSALVSGLQNFLPGSVTISGGLAADAGSFRQTWTLGPTGTADDQIVAVGLYGPNIRLSYGSYAGWEPFGPARKVTRCRDNVLYELDGERALDIYKRYLGDYAKDLPGSGLLFPFEMHGPAQSSIFRTILGVDEAEGSLTLAGDIDPNGTLKLMHSSIDKLVNGAETAARMALNTAPVDAGLALLISCIGRKLVMGDRVDEEVEAVAGILGQETAVTGFYSNGEIAGTARPGECRLHNQTMTITWIREA